MNADGTEKQISYPEYVEKVNARALKELKDQIVKKWTGDIGLRTKEDT